MKTILTAICLIITACGGSGNTPYTPTTYTGAVQTITIKGDSMAAGIDSLGDFTQYWLQWTVSVENDGISGADLNYLINNTVDHRILKTVINWDGYNTLKHLEISVATALALYSAYLNTLTYTKLICIGVPYNTTMDNARVDLFNQGIKSICPNYVDVSDIQTIDGIHPTPTGYMLVGQRIGALL